MNKKVRLILCVVLILIIGIVTAWHSLYVIDKDGQESGVETVDGSNTQVAKSEEDKNNDKNKDGQKAERTEKVLECQDKVTPICSEHVAGNAVLLCETEDCYLLCTAAHVVSGIEKMADTMLQIEIEGKQVNVKTLWISDTYDVAFLEIAKGASGSFSEEKETEPANSDVLEGKQTTGLSEEGYTNLKEGDILYVWSYYGGELMDTEISVMNPWIFIEDFGYHMIWASATDAKGGMSGSGVFDCDGHLAGILCGGNETEVVVLPVNIILGELKHSGIDISFE